MALIFVLSHQPTVTIPLGAPDYVAHALGYAVLAALIVRAFAGGEWARMSVSVILPAVVVATLYGVTDEWHQSFIPGRMASLSDLCADAVGAILGAGAAAVLGATLRARRARRT